MINLDDKLNIIKTEIHATFVLNEKDVEFLIANRSETILFKGAEYHFTVPESIPLWPIPKFPLSIKLVLREK